MNQRHAGAQPFRFFDNREKYPMFVTTRGEKRVSAERIGGELGRLKPRPPAVRLFDAGMGDGTVLGMVPRDLHHRWPSAPFLVVGKEISREDMRITTGKLADRFFEHPQMVIALTNMFYSEAPYLFPNRARAEAGLNWREVALRGNSTHQFDVRIKAQDGFVNDGWPTRPSPKTGNPLYVKPSVLALYREDQRFALDAVIPGRGQRNFAYDMVIASQPYRARSSAALKVRNVLAPLARSLAPGGRMITIQSTGRDPGMEIVAARRRRGGRQYRRLDPACRLERGDLRGADRGPPAGPRDEPERLSRGHSEHPDEARRAVVPQRMFHRRPQLLKAPA